MLHQSIFELAMMAGLWRVNPKHLSVAGCIFPSRCCSKTFPLSHRSSTFKTSAVQPLLLSKNQNLAQVKGLPNTYSLHCSQPPSHTRRCHGQADTKLAPQNTIKPTRAGVYGNSCLAVGVTGRPTSGIQSVKEPQTDSEYQDTS